MLARLRALISSQPEAPAQDPAERHRLATCVLLMEAAAADNEFSDAERLHILDTLQQRFSLSAVDAEELMDAAKSVRDDANDLWQFTNWLNQTCSKQEKVEILEELWRVIFADGQLDGHEDYLVHQLQRLMNLTHPDLIAAKLKVRQELSES